MKDNIHIYLSALLILLLSMLGGLFHFMYNRDSELFHRIEVLENNAVSRSEYNDKIKPYEYRIEQLEKHCCGELPPVQGTL